MLSSVCLWWISSLVPPTLPGVCMSVDVHQTPSDILRRPGDDVRLVCSHEKTDYRLMHWFQNLPSGRELRRIGHVHCDKVSPEDGFAQHFTVTGDMSGNEPKNGSLLIASLRAPDHSAVYYCAASYHTTDCSSSLQNSPAASIGGVVRRCSWDVRI